MNLNYLIIFFIVTDLVFTHLINLKNKERFWVDRFGRMYGEVENKDYKKIKNIINKSCLIEDLEVVYFLIKRYRVLYGDNALFDELRCEYQANVFIRTRKNK